MLYDKSDDKNYIGRWKIIMLARYIRLERLVTRGTAERHKFRRVWTLDG